jgi:hypothetical protein
VIRREYVDGPWGQVHLLRVGAGAPRVVLLHESPRSARVYEGALRALGPEIAAVAVDTAGYGMSDPPPAQCEIPDYARALLPVLTEIAGRDPLVVAGVHTGAALAVSVAAQAPAGLVGSLVLSGVTLLTAGQRAEFLAGWAPAMVPDPAGEHLRSVWERYQRIYGDDAPAEMLQGATVDFLQALDRYEWAYNAAFRYDPEDDLRALQIPVLFLTPEHDLLVASDTAAVKLVRSGRQELIADHLGQYPLRNPEEFARHLGTWMAARHGG